MKRKVFLFGGSGGRMLEALLFMAFAGITPEETLDLVLCDPDGDGMHGAVQLRQELADYQRIWASRTYIGTGNPAFQTEINLRTWCDPLPMNAKTLADWTQDEKQDALLCQALFRRIPRLLTSGRASMTTPNSHAWRSQRCSANAKTTPMMPCTARLMRFSPP